MFSQTICVVVVAVVVVVVVVFATLFQLPALATLFMHLTDLITFKYITFISSAHKEAGVILIYIYKLTETTKPKKIKISMVVNMPKYRIQSNLYIKAYQTLDLQ